MFFFYDQTAPVCCVVRNEGKSSMKIGYLHKTEIQAGFRIAKKIRVSSKEPKSKAESRYHHYLLSPILSHSLLATNSAPHSYTIQQSCLILRVCAVSSALTMSRIQIYCRMTEKLLPLATTNNATPVLNTRFLTQAMSIVLHHFT